MSEFHKQQENLFSKKWDKISCAIIYFNKNYSSEGEQLLLEFIESAFKSWYLKGHAAKVLGRHSSSLHIFESLLRAFHSTNSRDFKPTCEIALKVILSKIDVNDSDALASFLKKEKIDSLVLYGIRKYKKWTLSNWVDKLKEASLKISSTLKNKYQSKRINAKVEINNNIYSLFDCLVNSKGISIGMGIKTKMSHIAANRVNEAPHFRGLFKGAIEFDEFSNINHPTLIAIHDYHTELLNLEKNINSHSIDQALFFLPDITHKIKSTNATDITPHNWNYMAILNFAIKEKNYTRVQKIATQLLKGEEWGYTEYLQEVKNMDISV